ncbi:MAG: hypothetical protein CMH56_00760 [Myxococcales bacterium]|nr:hypothetical protein [Myxococcales bacterium]
MEKTPNLIYLDLSQNASAASLCGALLHLAGCEKDFQGALADLGLNDIFPQVQQHPNGDGMGQSLVLRDPLGMAHPLTATPALKKHALPRNPRPAQWSQIQQGEADTQNNTLNQLQSVTALQNETLKAAEQSHQVWDQTKVTLLDMKQCLKASRLRPLVQGICFRMFKEAFLTYDGASEPVSLDVESAKVLTCYVLAMGLALEALDPIGVTCSRVPFLNDTLRDPQTPVPANKLLALSMGLPTYETGGLVSADFYSLSILKAVVTDWGHRPQGRICQNAIGASDVGLGSALVQQIECAVSGAGEHQALGEVHWVGWDLLLSPAASLTDLRQGLVTWGAENWLTLAVHTGTGQPATLVKVCLPRANNISAQKWCFEEGFTQEIHTKELSISSLSSQRVVLPWGKGTKQQQISVLEHRWMNEVVQVVPNEADVARLAAESGFTTEAIRIDILNAWRRWNSNNEATTE